MIAIKLSFKTAAVLALAVVAAGAVAIVHQAFATPVQENPVPAARKDLHGDPLPEGALARLGTVALRTSCYSKFVSDGRRMVLNRVDGGLQVYHVPSGKSVAVVRAADLPGGKYLVGSTIGFTSDSRYLAAVCWEGGCGIWETATGRLVRVIEGVDYQATVQCDFSPDGKLLAVGTRPPGGDVQRVTIGVYEVESGRQLFTTHGTNSVFAPDGKALVVFDVFRYPGGHASRVDVPTGNVTKALGATWATRDIPVLTDGTWFFEITADYDIRVRDAATGETRHTFRGPDGSRDKPFYIRHAPSGRHLIAVGRQQDKMWCWDIDTGKEVWQIPLAAPAKYPALSRDGKTLVVGEAGESGVARVWDVATGKERLSFRPGAIGHSTAVQISPDGKLIATEGGNWFTSSLAFWDATTGKLLSDLPGHVSEITAAAFASDGETVYTAGKDGTLRTWDMATGRERSRFSASVAYLAVAADGKTLWVGQSDGLIRILNAKTGKEEGQIAAFRKALVGLALTADGKQLIVAGRNTEAEGEYLVQVWDVITRVKLREFGGADAKLEQLAVRPDGGAVATTHFGQRVMLWDANGKKPAELVGQSKRVNNVTGDNVPYRIGAVALSPDGRSLAFSDQEQGIVFVDAHTGQETGRVKLDVSHQIPSIRNELREVLAFSPDGKALAWSGVESTSDVFLIDVGTREVRRKLPGDSYPVRHLLFSPDGTKLLSAGPDGSALIWEIVNR